MPCGVYISKLKSHQISIKLFSGGGQQSRGLSSCVTLWGSEHRQEKDDIRFCHPHEKRFTALSQHENFIRLTAGRVIDQSRHMLHSSQWAIEQSEKDHYLSGYDNLIWVILFQLFIYLFFLLLMRYLFLGSNICLSGSVSVYSFWNLYDKLATDMLRGTSHKIICQMF